MKNRLKIRKNKLKLTTFGFTLIEMLGIITVLAVIMLIAFPNMSNSLKEMKENTNKNFTNNLKVSTETYIALNRDKYPELYKPYSKVYIKIQELYDANLMSNQQEGVEMNDVVTVLSTSDLEFKYFYNNKQIGYGVDPNDTSLTICDNVTTFCIANRSDLEQLATAVNNGDNKSGKIYILTQEIDLGGLFDSSGNALTGNNPWIPIGSETNPFAGTFDGAGHIIKGMYIDSSTEYTGLFSYIDGGTIKNLGIENSYIKSTQMYTGSISGFLKNGEISNVYNKGTVSGAKFTGGILGRTHKDATVKNCYNAGKVTTSAQFTGGIVGYNNAGTLSSTERSLIKNCYNIGAVNGNNDIGGIAGGNCSDIEKCYNLAKINATSNKSSGIVGQLYRYNSPRIINNYSSGEAVAGIVNNIYGSTTSYTLTGNYFLNTSATNGVRTPSSNEGASPLTIDEMPKVISVINDENAFVEDTKGINDRYPILKWQQ